MEFASTSLSLGDIFCLHNIAAAAASEAVIKVDAAVTRKSGRVDGGGRTEEIVACRRFPPIFCKKRQKAEGSLRPLFIMFNTGQGGSVTLPLVKLDFCGLIAFRQLPWFILRKVPKQFHATF